MNLLRTTRSWETALRSVRVAGTLGLIALAAQSASADLVNLNFTGTAYTLTAETSPATPTGSAGTWNNLTTSTLNAANSFETDSATVLLSDGSTGPTLTFDTTSGSTNVFSTMGWGSTSYATFPSTVNYTTAGGVYDVANLYESGLVNGGNNVTGFRVKGLAAGTYDVFLVPIFRSAQAAGVKADSAVTFAIGLGNNTDARNAGTGTLTSTAASPTQNIDTRLTTWVAATDGSTAYNYIGATVTIDSTARWLTFLLPDSATSGPDRPGPSVIQIRSVAIPEVSPFLLIGLVGTLTFSVSGLYRRRQPL